MTSDIEVTLNDGLPFDGSGITGVSITYGYNMIPAAMLSLNVPYIMETAPSFFEDPTQYKKSTKSSKPVVITIKSATGCLNFEGYFDGLSVVQTPGGMDYTAIIKNKFQVLTELYPKMIGIFPGSLLTSRFSSNIEMAFGKKEYEAYRVGPLSIPAAVSPPDFYKKYIEKVIEVQSNVPKFQGTTVEQSTIVDLVLKSGYQENIKLCKELVSKINTQFAQTPGYQCGKDINHHADMVANGGDDAWTLLLNVMNECGCVLLAGNKELFVVPQTNFLRLDGACPAPGEESTKINQAYPADYNNFVLNDNSFKNIKYCLVNSESSRVGNLGKIQSTSTLYLGQYPKDENDIEPDGSSGILITTAPPWVGRTLAGILMMNSATSAGKQDEPYSGIGNSKSVNSIEEGKKQVKTVYEKTKSAYGSNAEEIKKILDNYAKARFLTEKYAERTGSFNLQFNPNWCPATTGFLASRNPAINFNFFVTGVTHTISTSGGRVGTAMTQISFNSARYGKKMPGTDINDLYGYNQDKMKKVQEAWVDGNKK